jgi:hypothetical protein
MHELTFLLGNLRMQCCTCSISARHRHRQLLHLLTFLLSLLLNQQTMCPMHTQALALAEPRGPSCLSEPDAGAVLALACHCVMVDNGFVVSSAHQLCSASLIQMFHKSELPGGSSVL